MMEYNTQDVSLSLSLSPSFPKWSLAEQCTQSYALPQSTRPEQIRTKTKVTAVKVIQNSSMPILNGV